MFFFALSSDATISTPNSFKKKIASFIWLTLQIGILKIAPAEDFIVSPFIGELPVLEMIM